MRNIFVPDHLHLIVRGFIVNPPTTEDTLNSFLSELVKKVRMEILIDPHSKYCSDPGNEGITGTVVLSTSHASIHVWDKQKPALFQFDLYSCSEFTPIEVLDFIDENFIINEANWIFINRNYSDMKIIEKGSYK